jgi:hypothetical protein
MQVVVDMVGKYYGLEVNVVQNYVYKQLTTPYV